MTPDTPDTQKGLAERIARLRRLNDLACYRVMFCCSRAGDFSTEEAARERAMKLAATSDWAKPHILEVTEFDELDAGYEARGIIVEAMTIITALEATNAELRRRLDQQARKVMRAGTALLMGARPYPVEADTLPARSMVEDWRLKQLADAIADLSKPFDAEEP